MCRITASFGRLILKNKGIYAVDAMRPVKILIVDDSPLSRKGMRALLSTQPGLQVTGEASNGQEAVEQAGLLCPDVILMDAQMPCMDGLTATRLVRERYPSIGVIILTMYVNYRQAALEAGAAAF